MDKKELLRKLTSRKFWLALASFIAGLIIYCGGTPERATATEGLIMSVASVVVYLCAEGAADSSHKEE